MGGLPLQVYVVFGVLGALVVSQQWLVPRLDSPALATWSTIFVAIVVQSIPFLVLGAVIALSAVSAPELPGGLVEIQRKRLRDLSAGGEFGAYMKAIEEAVGVEIVSPPAAEPTPAAEG